MRAPPLIQTRTLTLTLTLTLTQVTEGERHRKRQQRSAMPQDGGRHSLTLTLALTLTPTQVGRAQGRRDGGRTAAGVASYFTRALGAARVPGAMGRLRLPRGLLGAPPHARPPPHIGAMEGLRLPRGLLGAVLQHRGIARRPVRALLVAQAGAACPRRGAPTRLESHPHPHPHWPPADPAPTLRTGLADRRGARDQGEP